MPQLFESVTIPVGVKDELRAEQSHDLIQAWIAAPPDWVTIQRVPQLIDNLPAKLGRGEREAISLAVSLQASLIILDDWEARQAALSQGLTVTGLLGLLFRAGTKGLLDFPSAIDRLQQTSFRASPMLIQQCLERYAQATGQQQ
jgi:predicted nucleic acid-binding protein